MEALHTIAEIEGIPYGNRTEGDKVLLAALYTERARLAGNNCVVFIMWLLSGDFISSSR